MAKKHTKPAPDTPEATPPAEAPVPNQEVKENFFKKAWQRYKSHKKIAIPVTAVVAIALLMAIPLTRYSLLGIGIKKDFSLKVVDSDTGKPVSEATVSLHGKTATTDGEGQATIQNVKVGQGTLVISKKYYKDTSTKVTVPLGTAKDTDFELEATGRQVPVKVMNKISGKPLANATIEASDTESKTDEDGEAVLVLPADLTESEVTIKLDGYNDLTATVAVTDEEVDQNTFNLVASGKLYFLSKRSGKIDVVKTDLDGSNRQTVLAGTGREVDYDTILLASRDWKYLALKSRREGNLAKLYLIETATDKLSTIDEGNAEFTLNGWSNDRFIFTANREDTQIWQAKKYALKSFNAANKQLTTIDENDAAGGGYYSYAYENLQGVYILENELLYHKTWYQYNEYSNLDQRKARIVRVSLKNNSKQTLKEFPTSLTEYVSSIVSRLYKPQEVYYTVQFNHADDVYYEYEDGQLKDGKKFEDIYASYPTYLLSPSGKKTFWSESRDGLNVPFLGDADADNHFSPSAGIQHVPYGWYTDDYLLLSKDGSELYIQYADKDMPLLKVTDYHKPSYDFSGYGYGYGGF